MSAGFEVDFVIVAPSATTLVVLRLIIFEFLIVVSIGSRVRAVITVRLFSYVGYDLHFLMRS